MLGHCHVKCKNKQTDPEYTGKEHYLKYLDFNLLYSIAMVQTLPTVEISVCDDRSFAISISSASASSNNIGYIYTIDFKFDDDLEQKTKKCPFFPEKTKANIDQFTDYQYENQKKRY